MNDETFRDFVLDQLQLLGEDGSPTAVACSAHMESYYEGPVDILEDHAQLRVWARQAVACQTAGSLLRRLPRRLR